MYQLAIFDLDGTLVNSIADLGGTANHLLEQRHLPTHPIDAYYRFVGNGVHKLCERCLPPDTPAAEVETFLRNSTTTTAGTVWTKRLPMTTFPRFWHS